MHPPFKEEVECKIPALLPAWDQARQSQCSPRRRSCSWGSRSGGAGAVHYREFKMASGEMTTEQFRSLLAGAVENLTTFSVDGSLHYLCMDWRHAIASA